MEYGSNGPMHEVHSVLFLRTYLLWIRSAEFEKCFKFRAITALGRFSFAPSFQFDSSRPVTCNSILSGLQPDQARIAYALSATVSCNTEFFIKVLAVPYVNGIRNGRGSLYQVVMYRNAVQVGGHPKIKTCMSGFHVSTFPECNFGTILEWSRKW